MRPNVIIGDCHLYLGDCREILPHLPKVDLILTDPPYSEKTHSNAKSNAGVRRGAKAIDFKAIDFKAIEELLDACSVICDGWIVANMDWRHIARLEFEPHHYFELVHAAVAAKHLPKLREALAKKSPAESPDVIDARHTAELKVKAAALVQSRLAQA